MQLLCAGTTSQKAAAIERMSVVMYLDWDISWHGPISGQPAGSRVAHPTPEGSAATLVNLCVPHLFFETRGERGDMAGDARVMIAGNDDDLEVRNLASRPSEIGAARA